MPLGYDAEQRIVNLGDTADLYAYLFDQDDNPVPVEELTRVDFKVEKPDGTSTTTQGAVNPDGSGFLLYTDTSLEGQYRVSAKFTFASGKIQSTLSDFQVADPFNAQYPFHTDLTAFSSLATYDDKLVWMVTVVTDKVWNKMEDLFDAKDGGPWLRDMTLNVFNPQKMPDFIEEALFNINVYNPPTHFWIEEFTTPIFVQGDPKGRQNENLPILTQGVWCAVIRHLMRSYAEQPLPQGGQITYEDRRDYLQRWGTIYQIENSYFDQMLKLWKRQFLSLNQSAQLVSSKAGRLLPAPLRIRNVGRGYY